MNFFQKNKIRTLLSLCLCVQGFSAIKIAKHEAHKQLSTIYSTDPEDDNWLIATLQQTTPTSLQILINALNPINTQVDYSEIESPSPEVPVVLPLTYEVSHVTANSSANIGYVVWKKNSDNSVEYVKIDRNNPSTLPPIQSITNSKFTGDSISITPIPLQEQSIAVAWNCTTTNSTNGTVSQVSIISQGGLSTATDTWETSNIGLPFDYSEAPKVFVSNHQVHIATNFYSEDQLVHSRLGRVDTTFSDLGEIQKLGSFPAHVIQAVSATSGTLALLSVAQSSSYSSDAVSSSIIGYDGTNQTHMTIPFQARSCFSRFTKTKTGYDFYYIDQNHTPTKLSFNNFQTPPVKYKFSQLNVELLNKSVKNIHAFNYHPHGNNNYITAIFTQTSNKTNVYVANINSGSYRAKTLTKKIQYSNNNFSIRLVTTTNSNSEAVSFLEKKYSPLSSTSDIASKTTIHSNKVLQYKAYQNNKYLKYGLHQLPLFSYSESESEGGEFPNQSEGGEFPNQSEGGEFPNQQDYCMLSLMGGVAPGAEK